ncbi:NUDIX hydrolase [Megasphaera paucivorans]|uniref:ADP-ribose pyrophosphatase n=1 Tax=Megasphaera paucivorans TaxID=349095 RepID=A0A1G9UEP4_9FIRM|nr:NUDIX hydrolase [Megasphaera paucivorans]SDM58372.1 ADP-ribose pyrophosphatase [Megasphaera paucivorans]
MSISVEKMIDRKEIMTGRVLHVTVDTVRINDSDITSTREAVWHHGASAILPLTDDGRIILVRQYRYAASQPMLEVPAGKIEMDGENPDICASRELEEEAGVTCDELISLGFVYTSPGFCDEKIYLYLARQLKQSKQHLDEDEFVNLERYTPKEMEQLILDGGIIDAKTIACFAKARPYLRGV